MIVWGPPWQKLICLKKIRVLNVNATKTKLNAANTKCYVQYWKFKDYVLAVLNAVFATLYQVLASPSPTRTCQLSSKEGQNDCAHCSAGQAASRLAGITLWGSPKPTKKGDWISGWFSAGFTVIRAIYVGFAC